ncbi:MAG: hypothetical protein JOZ81_08015 [Chloroflexi bacterium]|nr:hypothetical protein [Chloroflexota bacterium]
MSELRQRLAALGRYVAFSPGPNPHPNVEEELRRWLAADPYADAAAGFRAGWTRSASVVGPRLHDWEARFARARRDNAGLRSHMNALLAEIQRLQDR